MAGSKKAGRYMTVGETTYAPGDEVPAEVVALVDNPDVWDESSDDDGEPDTAPAKKAAAKKSASAN